MLNRKEDHMQKRKLNCWEIKKCGREISGDRTDDIGVCPAASDISSNGINSGTNGGRLCWAIAGTFCGGKVQGDFAQKTPSCITCEVFKHVKLEEGTEVFTMLKEGKHYQSSNK